MRQTEDRIYFGHGLNTDSEKKNGRAFASAHLCFVRVTPWQIDQPLTK
jgi:hypothetical protein